MKSVSLICLLAATFNCLGVEASDLYVHLSNDGPCVKGGRITFRADVFNNDGSRPSGKFAYEWMDNALYPHHYETDVTSNTTVYYEVDYPADIYPVGIYEMQVLVSERRYFIWGIVTSRRGDFEITSLLNGNMSIAQHNRSLTTNYVASNVDTRMKIDLRKGDEFYIKNNSSDVAAYWFVDCKYFGMTPDLSFNYKFAKPDTTHTVEALVIASHEPPTTTTVAPTTTAAPITTTTHAPNATSSNSTKPVVVPFVASSTTPISITTTITPKTTIAPKNGTAIVDRNTTDPKSINGTGHPFGNLTFPFVCLNNSVIPPDPKKTYGYFHREVSVRAPISNITVDGTNWIQPWDMLSLKVACQGSGPFYKCLEFHRGPYNLTGKEKCDDGVQLASCNFSILHYFLEPSVYTILVILDNEVSTVVYPLTINIYKVTTKPQLSVIVVPVSCSLVAVVVVIFGVAYYIQSRARFTVEVADFDFGQNNPEMEYKTFTERLRDSFNNTGYKQLNPENAQWQEVNEHVRGTHP